MNEEHAEKVYMIREVTAIQKLEQEVRVKLARKRYTSRYTMDDILGSSEEIRLLKKLAGRIAVFDQPVYIYGESGTGKELCAGHPRMLTARERTVHRRQLCRHV